MAAGGVGGVQFLSATRGTADFVAVAGANVHELDVNEQGFVATGTTRAALFNVQPAGGDDAFIAAFGPSHTLLWGHMLGTAGDETVGSSLFLGKTYVSGTTTGAFSGSADSGGDGFYATYSAPVPSRIQNFRASRTSGRGTRSRGTRRRPTTARRSSTTPSTGRGVDRDDPTDGDDHGIVSGRVHVRTDRRSQCHRQLAGRLSLPATAG